MDTGGNSNLRQYLRNEGWVIPPGKTPRTAEVIAESERNSEWIMEGGDDECQSCLGSNSIMPLPLSFPLRLEAMGTMKELLPNCFYLHGKQCIDLCSLRGGLWLPWKWATKICCGESSWLTIPPYLQPCSCPTWHMTGTAGVLVQTQSCRSWNNFRGKLWLKGCKLAVPPPLQRVKRPHQDGQERQRCGLIKKPIPHAMTHNQEVSYKYRVFY